MTTPCNRHSDEACDHCDPYVPHVSTLEDWERTEGHDEPGTVARREEE